MMIDMMMVKTNLSKKVPHDLVLVAAFLICCSHVVWNVQNVPEDMIIMMRMMMGEWKSAKQEFLCFISFLHIVSHVRMFRVLS